MKPVFIIEIKSSCCARPLSAGSTVLFHSGHKVLALALISTTKWVLTGISGLQ